MKTIVTRAFGQPPETAIEERPMPSAAPGRSLIRMESATINQLSNFIRTGAFGNAEAPLVLGNEGAGVVEAGERYPAGTRVVVFGGNRLGVTEDGLFQQWVVVDDTRLVALPDALNADEGANLSVNYLTAYRAMTHAASVGPADIVLVSGASGSVGHAAMQIASALGARPVGVVSTRAKAERVRAEGGEAIDLSAHADIGEALRAITGGTGASFAFDPVGGEMTGRLVHALAPGGTLISLGFAGGKTATFDLVDLLVQQKRVHGYSLHAESDADLVKALGRVAALAADGRIRPIIDTVVGIDDVEKGYARLTSREAIGSIVVRLHDKD